MWIEETRVSEQLLLNGFYARCGVKVADDYDEIVDSVSLLKELRRLPFLDEQAESGEEL